MNKANKSIRAKKKKEKLYKCKAVGCENRYVKHISFQTWCSTDCALIIAEEKKERARIKNERQQRVEIRERRKKLETKPELIKKLQPIFNRYIRLRDKDMPCISCDRPPTRDANAWDCGHYRTVGAAPELRFEELNAHKQCKRCNQYLGGNYHEYRARLAIKIGEDKLGWLEGPHEANNYTRDDLRGLIKLYRQKARELE